MPRKGNNLPAPALVSTTKMLGAGRKVMALQVDKRWEALIRPVTELKVRLDRVLNSRAWDAGEVGDQDLAWLNELGLPSERPYGNGVDADQFASWIVGPFRAVPAKSGSHMLTLVPSWSTVGWRRRRHKATNLAHALATRAALDADTAAGTDGTARWLRPLPLVVCGEGKHRVEMHAEFFKDQLVNLNVEQLPEAKCLRLKWVLGAPGVLALQHRSPDGWGTALLPFADLSLPIFKAMGVADPGMVLGWWVATPWSDPLRKIAVADRGDGTSSLGLTFRPSAIRTALLRSGYA